MDISGLIVEFGRQAVLYYREKAGVVNEAQIPEVFIARFVASAMTIQLRCPALPEVYFTNMLTDLDIDGFEPAVVSRFGGLRADIGVYQDQKPAAVVELKIVDESRPLQGVLGDFQKLLCLQRFISSRVGITLDAYIAALVCDTSRPSADELSERTIDKLRAKLENATLQHSDKMQARGGGWGWQFVCARLL